MTTHIEALTETLRQANFRANPWRDYRVYINDFGRRFKVFIELETPMDDAPENILDRCRMSVRMDRWAYEDEVYRYGDAPDVQAKREIMGEIFEIEHALKKRLTEAKLI